MKLLNTLVPLDFRAVVTPPVQRLYTTVFINCVGTGLTLSLYVVYLHNVRHLSEGFATLLLAITALVGLTTGPLWGTLIDRVGPVRVALVLYLASAATFVNWAFVRTRVEVIVGALAMSIFSGAGWGPGAVLMARLVPEEHRQRAYGINFMLVNLGIGFGGLISALVVDLRHPESFTVLYLFNAAITLVAGAFFVSLRTFGRPSHEHHHDPVLAAQGWRHVARDHRLVRYVVAAIVLTLAGYGALDTGLSLFVVNNLHISVHAIGIIFFFNTSTIVIAQLFMLNRIQGRSRTRVLALVGVCWFIFWIMLAAALAVPPVFAIAMVCAAMVVFAVGEIMIQPVGTALVNEMAPEHLRGRYNAAAGMAWGVAGTLAPATTSIYFSLHLGNWWPLGTGVLALIGSTMMLNLRHTLSPSEDGRRVPVA